MITNTGKEFKRNIISCNLLTQRDTSDINLTSLATSINGEFKISRACLISRKYSESNDSDIIKSKTWSLF